MSSIAAMELTDDDVADAGTVLDDPDTGEASPADALGPAAPELPDPATVEVVAPADHPDVAVGREQAAVNAVQQAVAAQQAVATAEALAANPDHPFGDADVAVAKAAAEQAQQRVEVIAAAQGKTVDELSARTAQAMDDTAAAIDEQLANWRRLRAQHQDFVDHPEAYGYVDFGGAPLIDVAQRQHVASYDAAIAQGEAQLAQVKAQRETLAQQ